MNRRFTALALALSLVATPALAEGLQRGVVFGEQVMLHTRPEPDAPMRVTLHDGDAVLVLERSAERAWLGAEKDYWYRVERDEQAEGWLHGSQVLTSPLEGHVLGSGVRLRQTPGTDGQFVTALSAGAWVDVFDRTPEEETIGDHTARWYRVRAGNATGWVFGAFLELALATPPSQQEPFLGWRCWPGKPNIPHPTEPQILAGLTRWHHDVEADIWSRLSDAQEPAAAVQALKQAWEALHSDRPADALAPLEQVLALPADAATPLGSAHAAAAYLHGVALVRTNAPRERITAAFDRMMTGSTDAILTGTNWQTPAALAAFDYHLFLLEQVWKDARGARAWTEALLADTTRPPIVRAAAGAAAVRLNFAARRESDAIGAARAVFILGADAQLSCGPMPVHFGATALHTAWDELIAVGGQADAIALCESVAQAGDPILQSVARARLAQLHDLGTADLDTVIAAYDAVPDFTARLASLQTIDSAAATARVAALRALTRRVGGSDQAWVTGERVRLRASPTTQGAVLAALERDAVVRLLYRPPAGVVSDDVPWIKVRVRGGQTGWMSEEYLELMAPRVAALPSATGMLWSQHGGNAQGAGVAPGAEIDNPAILWRVPDILSGGVALGDADGDGTADLFVTGVGGDRACPKGVAVLDGRTQGELWRADTVGCVDGRSLATGGNLVVVPSDERTLQAFRMHDGTLAWSWLADDGRLTAPAVSNDLVAAGSSDGSVAVLDLRSGELRLRARVGEPVRVRPVLDAQTLYAVTDNYLNAIDVDARRPRWRARLIRGQARAPARGQAVGGLALYDDVVIAAAPTGVLIACDARTGDPLWQVDMEATPVGGPIKADRHVFVALGAGEVRAWSVSDGAPLWTASAHGPIGSGMLLADHTLVVGSTDGFITGLSRVDGRLRWEAELEAPLDRAPAGGAGRVVVGSSQGPLYVLGDAALTDAPAAVPLRAGPATRGPE